MAILIVDDSADQQLLLRSILTNAGHSDVITAESAQTAFSALPLDAGQDRSSIDLILMDILMPNLNGIDACRLIKQRDHLRDIPIIMVTAKNNPDDLSEAFSAGAMDYISKPVNGVELLARVTSALTLKREMDCRKEREAELRRSNEELQRALKEVKVLRGLIPICASCKNIRTDDGLWTRIEEYLSEHSEVQFSHGLCQPCIKKLYPGVCQD
ncbi:response regulator [Candidatus Nitrospira inopinata]|jgi:CheY-like chemotaxis protein|uniref:Response regulator n=1 Tax=Candidatus Nitrospira inopinata TaxID=1715989 RepID=A0A0S4KUW8_9BACT|nr:response regulator [Candidatus Nitrospira inopinata]CUQ68204.1 Response regulator [Candidatus Nitrospira inopinata]